MSNDGVPRGGLGAWWPDPTPAHRASSPRTGRARRSSRLSRPAAGSGARRRAAACAGAVAGGSRPGPGPVRSPAPRSVFVSMGMCKIFHARHTPNRKHGSRSVRMQSRDISPPNCMTQCTASRSCSRSSPQSLVSPEGARCKSKIQAPSARALASRARRVAAAALRAQPHVSAPPACQCHLTR